MIILIILILVTLYAIGMTSWNVLLIRDRELMSDEVIALQDYVSDLEAQATNVNSEYKRRYLLQLKINNDMFEALKARRRHGEQNING